MGDSGCWVNVIAHVTCGDAIDKDDDGLDHAGEE